MANYTIKKEGKIFKKDFEYSEVTDDLDNLQNEDFNISTIRQITLWKLDRYVSLDKKVIKKINNLKSLTEFDEKKTRNVLKDLLACEGVGLPMASTYLRFRNPHVFQIIDARAYRAAFDYKVNEVLSSQDISKLIDIYIEYIEKLREIAQKGYHGLSVKFEDLDRFLYVIDKKAGFIVNEDKNKSYDFSKIEKWKELICNPEEI
ncbi:MAG: hypothetical protein IKJ98_09385 [Bacteroidales bacterium]|nr:hypothetical protein [Bacteroidales bacterium]